MLLNEKKKETRVKFNPRLSANQPSNNWAQLNCQVLTGAGLTVGRSECLTVEQEVTGLIPR